MTEHAACDLSVNISFWRCEEKGALDEWGQNVIIKYEAVMQGFEAYLNEMNCIYFNIQH